MCLRFQFCTHQRVCILYFLKKSQIRCTLMWSWYLMAFLDVPNGTPRRNAYLSIKIILHQLTCSIFFPFFGLLKPRSGFRFIKRLGNSNSKHCRQSFKAVCCFLFGYKVGGWYKIICRNLFICLIRYASTTCFK